MAVITGAGRGIGAACARALAEAGADVAIVARTQEQLDEVAADVKALGRHALVVAGDVSQLETLDQLVDATVVDFGRLDIVANNRADRCQPRCSTRRSSRSSRRSTST